MPKGQNIVLFDNVTINSDGYTYPSETQILNCRAVAIKLITTSDAITYAVECSMDGTNWTVIITSDLAVDTELILQSEETAPDCSKLDLMAFVWYKIRVGVKSKTASNPCVVNGVLNRRR